MSPELRFRERERPGSAYRLGGYKCPTSGRPERVDGTQKFLGEIRLEGMLHVKLVTLDVARARIPHRTRTGLRRVSSRLDE